MSANRGERRYRTQRKCIQRQREHLRWSHYSETIPGDGLSLCPCEFTPGVWKKSRPLGCGCTKRLRGQPKLASGMCDIGARNRIYGWRNQTRELRNLSRYSEVDWDSDEVALLGSPVTRHKD